ncbi:helix-turn-helix transcriptional regulator [Planotetraspora phitsanulokensis]|uniref:Transcriptional regulator n=1 Tax=Planotetraspora phitsanulokensis TaxID=575192 RepID=A0A8J3UBR6_9ACTN|nr:transcriptional regulator [Planotetraspora phitsanulokensis]
MRVGDRRRTPGLRRDEVASLAGVSMDYYTRLEQGRERRPSDQVLDALARVLHLDPEASEHLHELARPRTSGAGGRSNCVSPNLLRFIEGCDHALAFVVNRRLDFVAKNRLTKVLHEGFDDNDNVLRRIFLNPAAREFYVDWEREASHFVAHLRAVAGTGRDDPFVLELVEELSRKSEDFRRMWARHDVQTRTQVFMRFRHRQVGEMTLYLETLRLTSAPGHIFIIGQAEPGSPSAHALAELGRLAATTG